MEIHCHITGICEPPSIGLLTNCPPTHAPSPRLALAHRSAAFPCVTRLQLAVSVCPDCVRGPYRDAINRSRQFSYANVKQANTQRFSSLYTHPHNYIL